MVGQGFIREKKEQIELKPATNSQTTTKHFLNTNYEYALIVGEGSHWPSVMAIRFSVLDGTLTSQRSPCEKLTPHHQLTSALSIKISACHIRLNPLIKVGNVVARK
ncbi:hypothetical protein G9A89_020113 [Geosiphon pyriformis]|nr:hypothetical protein G9A89_020113 [Geosiphon pyriformis]